MIEPPIELDIYQDDEIILQRGTAWAEISPVKTEDAALNILCGARVRKYYRGGDICDVAFYRTRAIARARVYAELANLPLSGHTP